jgi:hypothetical protein
MAAPSSPLLRGLALLTALALLGAALVLGYIAVVALRRSEGVFMPAGYVALICMAGGVWLLRMLGRG